MEEYKPPREISINGIRVGLVDPHNEAMLYWFNSLTESPKTLLHLDYHRDFGTSHSLEGLERLWNKSPMDYEKYVKTSNCGTFISIPVYYGLLSSFYWINLRERTARHFGRVNSEQGLIRPPEIDGLIQPDVEHFQNPAKISYTDLIEDLKSNPYPLILDIDLDVFDCLDYKINGSFIEKRFPRLMRFRRLRTVINLIKKLPKPSVITIARSITPCSFISEESADHLEKRLLKEFRNIYDE